MIEGLAAIGLAGNIVQFIAFSAELLSKSREIYHSTAGVLNENVDLEVISQDISDLSDRLVSSAPSERFTNIVLRCKSVADELLDAISKLQSQAQSQVSQKRQTRWTSFRKALRSIWEKPRIEELRSRLDLLRDQVTTHLISNTSDNQIHLFGLFEKWESQNVQAGYKITEQIRHLDIQLQNTQRHLSQIHNEGYWKELSDHFSRLSCKVQQVSKCHTIIESLQYDYMEVRHDAIQDAHKRTFEWIFHPEDFQQSDRRSKIGFTDWLRNENGIYWVTGKPGSGKSTLMKYLYDHQDTIRHLCAWSKNARLVKGSFYFWGPGTKMQKSLEGLLRALLYHVLDACPDLAPKLCFERWDSEQSYSTALDTSWTVAKLKKAFVRLKTQSSLATNFFFHVDGLDEYNGDHWDVIETLKDLSASPNIKLCISSRPWNCFQDAFGRSSAHVLQLHDLTEEDIKLFARENLISYCRDVEFEPSLFDNLVHEIVNRAQGVFLWVRLVVRSLRDGIINEDPVSILHTRLQAIPTDLEEFFEHILRSVEDIYQTRMATTFLAALRTHHPLKIIHYYFLEQEDTTFGFNLPTKRWQESQIQRRVIQTQRRLNGRFKGLLEPSSTIDIGPQTTVDFLHRTLRDFLETDRMYSTLRSLAARELNVLTAVSRALIAESKFITEHISATTIERAVRFASHGAEETGDKSDYFAILDQVEVVCKRLQPKDLDRSHNCSMVQLAASSDTQDYIRYRIEKDGALLDLDRILKHAVETPLGPEHGISSAVSIAIQHARTAFDYNHCFPRVPSAHYINNIPSIPMIKFLLGHEANPNALIDGASSWDTFLYKAIRLMDGEHKGECWNFFVAFLQSGIDLNVKTSPWPYMLNREGSTSEKGSRTTLSYFKRLLRRGLNPNLTVSGTTIARGFLRILTVYSPSMTPAAQSAQNDLLREFLRYGAHISQVYEDTSDDGWLRIVLQELSEVSFSKRISSRIPQVRIFLEHGLDPNAHLCNGLTLWEHFLNSMQSGLQEGLQDGDHEEGIRQIILLSLSYGADPHASMLRDVLERMKGDKHHVSHAGILEIERALQKEMDQAASRAYLCVPSQPHCKRLFDAGGVKFQGISNIDRTEVLPQGQKRKAGCMSYGRPSGPSKRSRLGLFISAVP